MTKVIWRVITSGKLRVGLLLGLIAPGGNLVLARMVANSAAKSSLFQTLIANPDFDNGREPTLLSTCRG